MAYAKESAQRRSEVRPRIEVTTHRQAAAPVCQLGLAPQQLAAIRKVLEDAGIKFIDRNKNGGAGGEIEGITTRSD